MTAIESFGTYVPIWEDGGIRVLGPDEDMLTLAVAAGRAALTGTDEAHRCQS